MIVPATDRPPSLGACRRALEGQIGPFDELIVIEDGAGLGPAAARNRGAERATGEVLLFVDADIVAHLDVVARIRAAFAADPDLTGLFGAYDDRPSKDDPVGTFRNLLHHYVHASSSRTVESFWAGLGAIRRNEFMAAGGFDAAVCTSPRARVRHERALGRAGRLEDVDLGMRLTDAGATIRLDPSIRGTHLKSWTLREMIAMDLLDRGIPWVRLLCRRRRLPPAALALGWRHRLSALACLLGVSSVRRGRALGVAAGLAGLVGLNHRFYRLLFSRSGPVYAVAGVGLHAVHLMTAVAAVPLGILAHLSGKLSDDVRERTVGTNRSPVEENGAPAEATEHREVVTGDHHHPSRRGDPRDLTLQNGSEASVEDLVDFVQ